MNEITVPSGWKRIDMIRREDMNSRQTSLEVEWTTVPERGYYAEHNEIRVTITKIETFGEIHHVEETKTFLLQIL